MHEIEPSRAESSNNRVENVRGNFQGKAERSVRRRAREHFASIRHDQPTPVI